MAITYIIATQSATGNVEEQKAMQKVTAKCTNGMRRELAVVERIGRIVMLCTIERYLATKPEERAGYAVGFQEDDVIFEDEPAGHSPH